MRLRRGSLPASLHGTCARAVCWEPGPDVLPEARIRRGHRVRTSTPQIPVGGPAARLEKGGHRLGARSDLTGATGAGPFPGV
ncbi:hypothetical protein GQF56_05940 [Rhodobacter sphaeroides]|uniref:Uncharacterized protein n=1 Tax=Cereibacter sphaeroides (strain ATCC 17023 / DSM 158 / JCM 6121 / CCUG 31486 / LMG 2827 / NBRC 12203 / NCIMB 8253 / ATH 2.4.1.) TaxID=272943 RepID=U5NMV3_CERS4|nr:hypothetical protein RSP_7553 [Cereibacter sphaeroides 2.4.1]AXC61621.1 hypothetical protein DQL45_09680 [Cereibacter sphaeroides 2.4.1]MVX47416.1 hypothetical protein [Cereibacter sphaeroides]QHA11084.1 hypothetical protein GQR99_09675 [Cereibacter sphaeroides]QHA13642.1 hypothetical protein GQY06_09655 [Cereibacter sphaeroides]